MRIATIDIHVPFVENLTVSAPSLHLDRCDGHLT